MSNRDRNNKFPALPERCPSCEASRSQTAQIRQNFEKGRVISPIRGLSTGLGATVNLVSGNACYHLGEEGALADTIIFNDSRATASDTAAFLDKLHFSDLIRQLIIKNLQSVDVWSRQYIEEIYSTPDGDRSEKQKKDRERIKSLNSEVDKLLRLKDSDIEIDEAEENLIENFLDEYTGDRKKITWPDLNARIKDNLLEIGVNPAGPDMKWNSNDYAKWWDYFNDGPTQNSNLLDSKRLLLDELSANIIDVVMDFGRRDLETLGLACFRVKNINRLTTASIWMKMKHTNLFHHA